MKYVLLALTLAIIPAFDSKSMHAQELNEESFERLCNELCTDTVPAWRTIPWKISLLDAQRIAANEKKPIFIWAMDGHPLGCT